MLNKWHGWLEMPKFSKEWHISDLDDELTEYKAESKLIKKWSELSDVVYTCTRARWSGYNLEFPLKSWQYYLGTPYMLLKYSGRFLFYRRAGQKAGANKVIRCVRNPKKLNKLEEIIIEQKIDVDKQLLIEVCKKQLRHWPLLP